MKRHIVILSVLLLPVGGAAVGQTIYPADFRATLADPAGGGSRVTVEMSAELGAMLDRPNPVEGRQIEGYRVYIYNENHQNAGTEAQQTLAQFHTLFPDIPAEIIKRRDSPYWKVAVGNGLSRDEVMMIFGRVKGAFGSAYTPAPEMLPLRNFLPPPPPEILPADGESPGAIPLRGSTISFSLRTVCHRSENHPAISGFANARAVIS